MTASTLTIFVLATLLLTGGAVFAVSRGVPGRGGVGAALSGTALLVLTLLYIFTGGEILLKHFFIQSDGFNFTLGGRRWLQKYWKPTNSFGFRDIEHSLSEMRSRRVLFVIGDSFAAGHGIKDIRNRFGDILRSRLGPEWSVPVISQNGWSFKDEYRAVLQAPVKPEAVVLSYFINDVEPTAARFGLTQFRFMPKRPAGVFGIVNHSYFLNFIYWRVYRLSAYNEGYTTNAYGHYEDERVWREHARDLRALIDYADKKGIGLFVLVWPGLTDIEGGKKATAKVAALFSRHGVPVVDLAQTFAGRNSRSLIVNANDDHPNEKIHREVAGLLYELITASR